MNSETSATFGHLVRPPVCNFSARPRREAKGDPSVTHAKIDFNGEALEVRRRMIGEFAARWFGFVAAGEDVVLPKRGASPVLHDIAALCRPQTVA